jgi:hypothetical protein
MNTKICKENGCNGVVHARQLCSMHYTRWLRYGSPNIVKKENHGYRKHPLYNLWNGIKVRCYNKNREGYRYWGGRGIIMCDEWKNSPKSFIEWSLSNGWKKGLTIDRINNDGNYCPENCRFVTHKENILNSRLLQRNNTSGYRGVSYSKRSKRWVVYITINNKAKYLGSFKDKQKAAIAYNDAIVDNRPRNIL